MVCGCCVACMNRRWSAISEMEPLHLILVLIFFILLLFHSILAEHKKKLSPCNDHMDPLQYTDLVFILFFLLATMAFVLNVFALFCFVLFFFCLSFSIHSLLLSEVCCVRFWCVCVSAFFYSLSLSTFHFQLNSFAQHKYFLFYFHFILLSYNEGNDSAIFTHLLIKKVFPLSLPLQLLLLCSPCILQKRRGYFHDACNDWTVSKPIFTHSHTFAFRTAPLWY